MRDGELLRVEEVQSVLGIGRSKVYEMIRRDELPTLRIGRLIRVPRWALAEWIELQTRSAGRSDDEVA